MAPPSTSRNDAAFSRLSVVSRSKQVQDQLSGAILRGDFAPGDRLPSERELTGSFGVSRVSVREALKSLEALGLVEVRHGNGCFVSDPATRQHANLERWFDLYGEDIEDLIDVRGVLDARAAELAARSAPSEALADVESAADAFADAVEHGAPIEEVSELDREFHTALARASGNDLLAGLLEALHQHLSATRRIWLEQQPWQQSSAREHAAITRAIVSGRPDAARRAVARHMVSVEHVLDEYRSGLRPAAGGVRRRARSGA